MTIATEAEVNKKDAGKRFDRDETSATLDGAEVEDAAGPQEPGGAKVPPPFTFGLQNPTHFGVSPNTIATDVRVTEAFKISRTLQLAAILDCFLVVLTATSAFLLLWPLLYLVFVVFGLIGRSAAKSFKDGKLLMTYMIYCNFTIAGRIALAITFGNNREPYELAMEIIKAMIQLWCFCIALQFRLAVRKLTPDEAKWLREGRPAIARGEMPVYV